MKLEFRICGPGCGIALHCGELRQVAFLSGPTKIEQVGKDGRVVRLYNESGSQFLLTRQEFLDMVEAEFAKREFEDWYFQEED